MPPATLPADPTLKPSTRAAAAWAAFDPAWYLQSYPSVRECLSHDDPDAARHVYLETGQMLGHSPNRYFDEAWHRRAYPDVAAALGRNAAASGFDLYCRGGFRSYSPHWLFDERLYRQRYPDLAEEVLAAAGMANGYDHYLRHGAREMRIGHLFFDSALYLAQLDEDEAREAAAAGPFHHYLSRIAAGPHEARTTLYFDPEWYSGEISKCEPSHRAWPLALCAASLSGQRDAERIRPAARVLRNLLPGALSRRRRRRRPRRNAQRLPPLPSLRRD